jgi:MFS family permease
MAPVALALLVTQSGGSLSFAGSLSALYVLASALSQPIKGRLMACFGQPWVSGPATVINASCLLAAATLDAPQKAAPNAGLVGLVGLAGLCTPPLEAGLRALWSTVLPDPAQRRVALALDTGTQGLLYVAGPVLVAVLVSLNSPETALIATAAAGLTGAAVVLTCPASLSWRSARPDGGTSRSPLRTPGLRVLFLSLFSVGFSVGALTVWAVALAAEHQVDLLSGLIPAAFSAGSLIGGLLYSRRAWPHSIATQLLVSAGGFALGWLPLLTHPGPYAMVLLAVVPGLFLPLVTACAYMSADLLAPTGAVTEAYAWLILASGVGTAVGNTLAGMLAGPVLPVTGAAAALALLVCSRTTLTRSGPRHPRA